MRPMFRATRIIALLALALASLSAPVAAHDGGSARGRFRVLYAEPVVLEGLAPGAMREAVRNQPSRASFDAYGRRFELVLESNRRLLAGLDESARAEVGPLQLLKGTLQGVPGSWVRLAVDGDRKSGMVWDGRDLYVIEPAEDVAPRAVAPLGARGRSPVVYRLSDTMTDPGMAVCEAVRIDRSKAGGSALGDYKALMVELDLAADDAARRPILQAAQRMLAEDAVNGFLFQLPKIGVWNARLMGQWADAPVQANDLTAVYWREP